MLKIAVDIKKKLDIENEKADNRVNLTKGKERISFFHFASRVDLIAVFSNPLCGLFLPGPCLRRSKAGFFI